MKPLPWPLLLVLFSLPAHAIEKCVKDGKVIYTDQPCAALDAQTQKSFVLADNTMVSPKTQYLRYKARTGELTGTTTTTYPDGRVVTRPMQPEDINSGNVRGMAYPAEPARPRSTTLGATAAPTNGAACEQLNRELEENAWNARQRHVAEAQDYLADVRRKLHDRSRQLGCSNPRTDGTGFIQMLDAPAAYPPCETPQELRRNQIAGTTPVQPKSGPGVPHMTNQDMQNHAI